MGLKITEILKLLLPKGKAWEFQANFNYLLDGMSTELSRGYESAKNFYTDFNLIENEALAKEHSKDYLIELEIYTELELQRIIVEYLNKDLGYKEIIEDFANFINSPIVWEKADPIFGDNMVLAINYSMGVTSDEYDKISYLVEFFKPPYLLVIDIALIMNLFTHNELSAKTHNELFVYIQGE